MGGRLMAIKRVRMRLRRIGKWVGWMSCIGLRSISMIRRGIRMGMDLVFRRWGCECGCAGMGIGG